MRTNDGLLVVDAGEGLAGPNDIVVKPQSSESGGRLGVAVVTGVPGEGGQVEAMLDIDQADEASAIEVRRRHGIIAGRDCRLAG